MNKIHSGDFGIYIHYPFCTKKCGYCDFLSFAKDEKTKRAYEKALIEEIKDRSNQLEQFQKQGRGISLFIGGGTPSLMGLECLKKVLRISQSYLVPEAEISIEVNPGTCDQSKLEAYRDLGINRLSFGLQSVHDKELALLGRIHTFETFQKQYDLARTVGFDNINVDLMMGLPNQDIKGYLRSLEVVMALEPEHISAYSLIIEEGTAFYEKYALEDMKRAQGGIVEALPNEDLERQMYQEGRNLLLNRGYLAYEVSNYSKPGYECVHNLGYWQLRPYLGFGLGAASYWPSGHQRMTQTKDLLSYIEGKKSLEIENLSRQEEMEEAIFLPLRTFKGIDISYFEDRFQIDFQDCFGSVIQTMVEEGYAIYKKNFYLKWTPKGMDVGDYLILQLIEVLEAYCASK